MRKISHPTPTDVTDASERAAVHAITALYLVEEMQRVTLGDQKNYDGGLSWAGDCPCLSSSSEYILNSILNINITSAHKSEVNLLTEEVISARIRIKNSLNQIEAIGLNCEESIDLMAMGDVKSIYKIVEWVRLNIIHKEDDGKIDGVISGAYKLWIKVQNIIKFHSKTIDDFSGHIREQMLEDRDVLMQCWNATILRSMQ